MTPLVSVVIPAYNRAGFVGDAIQSALRQTHRNLEVIVVNDGSTDDTDKIVERYSDDGRVRYFKHSGNRGIPGARNTGIRHARGQYIGFLDSDDMWLPNKLEVQLRVFAHDVTGQIGTVWSNAYVVDQIGNAKIRRTNVPRNVDTLPCSQVLKLLFQRNFVIAQTAVVRRACFDQVGLLDEELRGGSDDRDLWLRLAPCFRFKYVPIPLATIRLHSGNYSSVQRQVSENFVIVEKAIAANPELSCLRSAKLARLHYILGIDCLELGDVPKARHHLRQAIAHDRLAVKSRVAAVLAHSGPVGALARRIWRKFRPGSE